MPTASATRAPALPTQQAWRVGMDLVQISQIAHSLAQFGQAFTARFFTPGELGSVTHAGRHSPAGLAARFAAKEAVIKALNLGELGLNWRDIEVRQGPDGSCALQLHGRAAAQAQALGLGQWQLSLSHDGDYAAALVIGRHAPPDAAPLPSQTTASHTTTNRTTPTHCNKPQEEPPWPMTN